MHTHTDTIEHQWPRWTNDLVQLNFASSVHKCVGWFAQIPDLFEVASLARLLAARSWLGSQRPTPGEKCCEKQAPIQPFDLEVCFHGVESIKGPRRNSAVCRALVSKFVLPYNAVEC